MIRSTRKKRRFDKSLETKRERERRNFREERDGREGISRYITGRSNIPRGKVSRHIGVN